MIWRAIQKQNFTSVLKLAEFLQLDSSHFVLNSKFPLNVPKRLVEKMEKGNIDDPILRQFVPLKDEEISKKGFLKDRLNESEFKKSPKLLQKYKSRSLLLASSACAMNCRFCFRRHFPYEKEVKDFSADISLIKNDPSLEEIILSGGDPLSLSDETISHLFAEFEKIEHLKRIRFHTRFPIGIPERITDEFVSLLQNSSKQIIFIVHTNHPKELDDDIFFSLRKIQKLGIPILTHTVLLKGVNDSKDILKALFQKLVNHGIMPYYMNDLDEVDGTSHFEVSLKKGKSLLKQLREELSGYAVPQFAKEIPHEKSKTLLHFF